MAPRTPELDRKPLTARRSASSKPVNEADKENTAPLHSTSDLKPDDYKADLATRERELALREQRVDEQSRKNDEKVSDLEVLEMRLKERRRALKEKENSAQHTQTSTLTQVLGTSENREREAQLAAREQQLANAEAVCSSREQTLAKREEVQQRAERKSRSQEAAAAAEPRSGQAETALLAKERLLAAREEKLARTEQEFQKRRAREESIDDREARVARLEGALAERERRAATQEANVATQAKGMVERSRDLTVREGAAAERQRQLDARSARVAAEAARLATEASRMTAERLTLQGEAEDLDARRAAFMATCANRSSAQPIYSARGYGGSERHVRTATDDAEPTWHSVADDGGHSEPSSPGSDDAGSQVPQGSLNELLRQAELAGESTGPINSKGAHGRPQTNESGVGRAAARTVRFVSDQSYGNAADLGCYGNARPARDPRGSTASSSGPVAAGSQHGPAPAAKEPHGTGSSKMAPRSLFSTFGDNDAPRENETPSKSAHAGGYRDASSVNRPKDHRFSLGGPMPSDLRDQSDRTSISSSVNGSRGRLTARKKIQGRASCAAHGDGSYMTLASCGASMDPMANSSSRSRSNSVDPAGSSRAPMRPTSGLMPTHEAEAAAPGALARLAAPLSAPFSALRRSLGGG